MQCPVVILGVQLPGKPSIKSVSLDQLSHMLQRLNEPDYRAKQIVAWIYRKRVDSFDCMSDLSLELREQLKSTFTLTRPALLRSTGSRDQTRKFLIRLEDGDLIESVLIPASPALYGSRSDRLTICISTQVGCAYGCKFCASGLNGWQRNLTPDEIIDQILAVEAETGQPIDNIVFMGMGEPLANYDNLLRAIEIINAPWGLGIGARHITVSTSGLVPQIRKLAEQPLQVRLAVSLHGATDEIRNRIMPVNRRYNVAALFEACRYYTTRKKQRITFEYILIADVNDSIEQAAELAAHALALNAKVNLIPYNTVAGLPWTRSSRLRQESFKALLDRSGVAATLRREKGHEIAAACGQLRLQTERAEEGVIRQNSASALHAENLLRQSCS